MNQFEKAHSDFIMHCVEDIHSEEQWEEARRYVDNFLECRAAELEVTVDYYLSEFV